MSIQKWLEEVARRGSRVGGGSVAALGAAMAAALLEKLIGHGRSGQRLRRIRCQVTRAIEQDAKVFARVIEATRHADQRTFCSSLKAATALQVSVLQAAREVQRVGRAARRTIRPRFQSDLRCAMALASAAAASAKGLIRTNLTWLNDPLYTHRLQRSLRQVS